MLSLTKYRQNAKKVPGADEIAETLRSPNYSHGATLQAVLQPCALTCDTRRELKNVARKGVGGGRRGKLEGGGGGGAGTVENQPIQSPLVTTIDGETKQQSQKR